MTDTRSPEDAQQPVVALLSDPSTHGGAPVERVDTAISRIFLAGERAYKMKRALRTNFLDFSTLARRRRSCLREIEVNAAAAPLYLGVEPVTCEAGRLRLGGDGDAVEWLTVMRRFDRAHECDRLLETGALDARAAERLADAIAAMHAAAPALGVGQADPPHDRVAQIAGALSAVAPEPVAATVAAWRVGAQALLAETDALHRRRIATGRVRRCHGDLHLGNIVMLDGAPTPFDAIEFDERLAAIDVLYDLAMTLADLTLRARRDLACVLLERYLAQTGDHAGLARLPAYLSMREAIRAMAAFAAGDAAAGERRLTEAGEALRPPPPARLIAVGGVSGSGKTSLARRLAPRFAPAPGAVVVRSDVARKRLCGVAPETRLADDAYTAAVSARVRRRIMVAARRILRAGYVAILDATFLDAAARAALPALAREEDVAFCGLWLDLPADVAARRIAQRVGDASDATPALAARQSAGAGRPEGWTALDAAREPDAVTRQAIAALRTV